MAEEKTSLNFGRIFNNYIRPTRAGNKINVPVLDKNTSHFVNVILSPGETVDLISALQDALIILKKGVVSPP